MPARVVAVTGSTGGLGGRIARRLAARGVRQRLLVRDVARAPRLPMAAAAKAPYRDSAAMRAALRGVDTLLLVSAPEVPDRIDLHRRVVDAAAAAGVSRIVYTSLLGAAPEATFTFARDHWHTEQHIAASGLAYTFLRNSIYQDILPFFVGDDGVLRGPAGAGRFAPVARDDVADVAAAILCAAAAGSPEPGRTAPGPAGAAGGGPAGAAGGSPAGAAGGGPGGWSGARPDGRAYDVTGPQALTMAEVAGELAGSSGLPISYHDETEEEAYASRAAHGTLDWVVTGWVTSYAAIAAGELDVVTDTVARISGHLPMTFAAFLRTHRVPAPPRGVGVGGGPRAGR